MASHPTCFSKNLNKQLKGLFYFLLQIGFFCFIVQIEQSAVLGNPNRVSVPYLASAPTFSEFLTEKPPLAGYNQFVQYRPGDGAPPHQPTTVYTWLDAGHIYVVFNCQDDPALVRGNLSKREDIFNDDRVTIFLDTFYDHQRAYLFTCNPLGVQLDGILTEGQGVDYSFDTIWESEGKITPQGYSVWLKIPLKNLRFPNTSPQTWGVAFSRITIRNNENDFFPAVTTKVQGLVQQFAPTTNLENLSPGKNIQITPYTTIIPSRLLDLSQRTKPQYEKNLEVRVGFDAKLVFKDSLTLDLTVNPDFSQVESDQPQVLTNQRFELFFPERRPFFVENAGFFQTPIDLFFSRRIADPRIGLRLTGKFKQWNLGLLAIDDRASGKQVPETNPLAMKPSVSAVIRAQRQIGKQSNVGFFASHKSFGSTSNFVWAGDARLRLTPQFFLTGQWAQSHTRFQTTDRVTGHAGALILNYADRHVSISTTYRDFSRTFRAALGFIPRLDIRQLSTVGTYTWIPDSNRLVTNYGIYVAPQITWNQTNELQDWKTYQSFFINLKRQTVIENGFEQGYVRYLGKEFRTNYFYSNFASQILRKIAFNVSYQTGRDVNYFPAKNQAPFLAKTTDAILQFTYRPLTNFQYDQTYLYRGLKTIDPAPGTSSASVFDLHIFRSKINWQFTKRFSARIICDYNALLANKKLIDDIRSKRITTDFLLTYFVSPGTAFYLGYTQRNENLLFDGSRVLHRGSPSLTTGNQFFVKLSYTFRF